MQYEPVSRKELLDAPYRTTLGELALKARKEFGLSREALALEMKLPELAIRKVEVGQPVDSAHLRAICEYLGLECPEAERHVASWRQMKRGWA